MNRTILTVAGVFSASSLLLVDSAIKGTAILVLAAIAAMILRRDSAATRYLVWLLAIVAMLVVPVLSAMLPQWRVLPGWAGISPRPVVVDISPHSIATLADGAVELPQHAEPVEIEQPSATAYQPAAELPDSRPALAAPEIISESVVWRWSWLNALPLVWAIGFCVLIVRLIAARLMLWNAERHGTVIWSPGQPGKATHDPLATALEAVCAQLGICRPVTLLLHSDKTIPVVWGILRCHLLLPVAARQWTGEQLRSVLLHELAHLQRRDTMAQLITQIVCALYWFNPLVWFAAWRLEVERERACDDLVLASGVRPSAYAGHVLDVVTGLSPARGTQSCGLAMAHKSSLEDRLAAVLGKNLNRRGVSVALSASALAIAVGIAVPIAMLRAAVEEWSPPHASHVGGNEFSTYCVHDDKTAAYVIAYRGDFGSSSDNNSNSKARTWNEDVKLTLEAPAGKKEVSFRRNHTAPEKLKIAGEDYDLTEGRVFLVHADGVVRQLAIEAPIVRVAKAAAELERKIAAIPPQARGDATAVKDEPQDAKSKALFESWKSSARSDGMIPGGRIGEMAASLKTYMDLNAGTEAATMCESVFKKCDATHDWTPAEAAALLDEIEVVAPSRAEWAMRTNIERKIHPGKPLPDELAKAPWGKPAENGLRTAWLLEPRAQTQALDSVMKSRVLFHNTGKEPVCFATEDWIQSGGHKAKDASGKDINVWALSRMGLRTRMVFRLAHGEYAEVEGHGLGVGSHETSSEKSIYKVGCWIEAREGDDVTFTPAEVLVSFQTWQNNEGRKDSTTVWQEMIAGRVAQESPMPAAADRGQLLRRVTKDLLGTAPTAEEVAAFTADNAPDALAKLTKALQARAAAMHFAGELSGGTTEFLVTAAVPKKDEPNQGAKLQPGTEQKLEWGEPVNGLRMALAWPPTLGEPAAGEVPDLFLAVQNVSAAPLRLCTTAEAPNQRRLTFATNGVLQGRIVSSEPNGTDATLGPREVVFLRLFTEDAKNTERAPHGSMLAATVRQSPTFTLLADIEIAKAPAGAWTGKLVTPETRAGIGAEAPKNRKAQELFKVWLAHARVNGKVPGGCIGWLGDKVKEFVRANTGDKSGDPYAKQMAPLVSRLDGARDWQPAEASALLTDVVAVSDVPLSVMLEEIAGMTIQYGPPLMKELENAPWGKALPNGLRVACLLEPRAAAHRLGTPLKMRIVVHNAGKEPVVFRSRTWHHIEPTAHNAKGAAIEMESITRYTRPPLVAYRLVPGGFVELASPGIGIGKYGFHNFKGADIASWIGAKAGDEVTLTPGPVPLGDWNEVSVVNGEPRWWLDFLAVRLKLATPLPADAAERAELLRRTVSDVFYTDATAGEIAAFVADREPDALDSLAKRLAGRSDLTPFSGSLQSGPTKFRVLAADPDGAKKPGAPKPATEAPK